MYSVTLAFKIDGMTCVNCQKAIEKIFQQYTYHDHGVKIIFSSCQVDWAEKSGAVTLHTTDNRSINQTILNAICHGLEEAMEDVGFECRSIDQNQQAMAPKRQPVRRGLQSDLTKSLLAYLVGLSMMVLSFLGITMPLLFIGILMGIAFLVTLYGGWKYFKSALLYLFKYRLLTMDTLFTLGVVLSWGMVLVPFFLSIFPFVWPVTPLLIVAGMCGGKFLEKHYHNKVNQRIKLTSILPEMVSMGGRLISIHQIKVGDIIEVGAGEVIPLDGLLPSSESGNAAEICTRVFDGRILPTQVSQLTHLVSGMRVVSGRIRLKVTKSYEDAYLVNLEARLARSREAAVSKSKKVGELEQMANGLVTVFIPTILVIAAISALLIGYFFGLAFGVTIFLSQISGACPCVLGWIQPLGKKMAIKKAAKYGAELASTDVLDRLNRVNTYVFDLNGTLTQGAVVVTASQNLSDELDDATFFSILVELERHGNIAQNSIGQAVLKYAKAQLLTSSPSPQLPLVVSKEAAQIVSGVSVKINGEGYYLGNGDMLARLGILEPLPSMGSVGKQRLFLVKNQQIIGCLTVADPLRSDSAEIIKRLYQNGKRVFLCTGSDKRTAQYYGTSLGIDSNAIFANCHDKASCLKQIKATTVQGVAMVGDAINDLPAFAVADLKVTTDCANQKNRDNADISINSRDLAPLLCAMMISKASAGDIKVALIFTMSYNVLELALPIILLCAASVTINPAFLVTAMFIQAGLVLAFLWGRHNRALSRAEPVSTERAPSSLWNHTKISEKSDNPMPTQRTAMLERRYINDI